MKFQRLTYKRTEADLLAEFYHHARKAGLEMYLEVSLPSSRHRSGKFRADAVVVHDDEIICCIEAKSPGSREPGWGRQYNSYKQLEKDHGIQTLWLTDWDQIKEYVEVILYWRDGSGATAATAPQSWKQEPGKPSALQVMVDGA